MYRILEHIVNEVGVGLNKVVQNLQNFQILLLSLEEGAKCHVITVEFNSRYGLKEFLSVRNDRFISLLDFLFLFLKAL